MVLILIKKLEMPIVIISIHNNYLVKGNNNYKQIKCLNNSYQLRKREQPLKISSSCR